MAEADRAAAEEVERLAARLDLNLLAALDLLLQERSVTRAARRLGVTQSAMSHKLRRLREQLGDPLLVPQGRQLVPTARAEALEAPLRVALRDLVAAVRHGARFDPATTERTFVLACSDLMELALLPHAMEQLAELAPGVRLVVRRRTPRLADELAAGDVDLYVGPGGRTVPGLDLEARAGLVQRTLGEEGFRVLAAADHPGVGQRLTRKRFVQLPHLLVSPGGGDRGVVDLALAKLELTRRVALRIPHFVAAPFIVARTELLFTCPERFARAAAELAPLRSWKPPVPLPATRIIAVWHERFRADPAHRWLRERFAGWVAEGVPRRA
ncbi:MAG TPA: LysR family transcriptional regulator [Polyangiaceae bacterium LLY-WYZ-15_(1-7)]|nr:LysR family transcriptional regulator [Polyangiaceae bacterium LLY-WYZ-15_(1-7)]HJL35765.1 LysR family transcriptional regulator [Polyangiaceae bacterium LLY-WYZ-15_(1-7)]